MSRRIYDVINIRKKEDTKAITIKCEGCGATLNKAIAQGKSSCPYCDQTILLKNYDSKMLREIKRAQKLLEQEKRLEEKRRRREEKKQQLLLRKQQLQKQDNDVTYIIDALKVKDVESYLNSDHDPNNPNTKLRGRHIKHTVLAIDKDTKKKNNINKIISVLGGFGLAAVGTELCILLNSIEEKKFSTGDSLDFLTVLAFTASFLIGAAGAVYGLASLYLKPYDVPDIIGRIKTKFIKDRERVLVEDPIPQVKPQDEQNSQVNMPNATMEVLNNQSGEIQESKEEQEDDKSQKIEEENKREGVMRI